MSIVKSEPHSAVAIKSESNSAVAIKSENTTGCKRARDDDSVCAEKPPVKRTKSPTYHRLTPAFFATCFEKSISQGVAKFAAALRDLAVKITEEQCAALFPGKSRAEVTVKLSAVADLLLDKILGEGQQVVNAVGILKGKLTTEHLAQFDVFVGEYLPHEDMSETTEEGVLECLVPEEYFSSDHLFGPSIYPRTSPRIPSGRVRLALIRLVSIKTALDVLLHSGDLVTGLEDLQEYLKIHQAALAIKRVLQVYGHGHPALAKPFEEYELAKENADRFEQLRVDVFVDMLSFFPREMRELAEWLVGAAVEIRYPRGVYLF